MGIKWDNVKLWVSPLTNSIYIGKTKMTSNNTEIWIDKSDDKTSEAILCVMEHMLRNKYEKGMASYKSGKTKLTVFVDNECESDSALDIVENNKLLEEGSKQLVDEIKLLIKDRELLVSMLKEVEFVNDTGRVGGAINKFCPICHRAENQKHENGCKLAEILNIYEGGR